MKLVQGKFYDSEGKIVPLEFGNKEQIKLIQEKEKIMSEGLEVELDIDEPRLITGTISFNCFQCDKRIHVEEEGEDDQDIINCLVKRKKECPGCKVKYTFEESSGNFGVVVKLEPIKKEK